MIDAGYAPSAPAVARISQRAASRNSPLREDSRPDQPLDEVAPDGGLIQHMDMVVVDLEQPGSRGPELVEGSKVGEGHRGILRSGPDSGRDARVTSGK